MQKPRRQYGCSKCNVKLDNSNNGPKGYSSHHILPKKWYHGTGRTIVLCRACHDILEAIIKSAEGKGKTKLDKETYEMLCENFIHSAYWDRSYE